MKIYDGILKIIFSFFVLLCVSGCIMQSLSETRINGKARNVCVNNKKAGQFNIATVSVHDQSVNPLLCNIDVGKIRRECNKYRDDNRNRYSIRVVIHRNSQRNINGFWVGLNGVLSLSTLFTIPLYDLSIIDYDVLFFDAEGDGLVLKKSKTSFKRWHCISLLPLPWLVKTPNSDFYWSGAMGKDSPELDNTYYYWVKALGTYEEQVLTEAILDALSSEEMQVALENKKKKNKELQLQAQRAQLEEKRKKESRIAKAKEAEEKRRARGIDFVDFFGIPFYQDITEIMADFNILPEDSPVNGVKIYNLGLSFEKYHREMPGSRQFMEFRPHSLLIDEKTKELIGIESTIEKPVSGRNVMSKGAAEISKEISRILFNCKDPEHEGKNTFHKWTWDVQDNVGRDVRLTLSATVIDQAKDMWGFSFFIFPKKKIRGENYTIQPDTDDITTGTGWFAAKDKVVTCHHVVKDASNIKIKCSDGLEYEADVTSVNEDKDVALLSIKGRQNIVFLPIKPRIEPISTEVFTIGYPIPGLLGGGCKYTDGTISAQSGLAGNKANYQISVPIQPGNSGGALVNGSGQVVGVTTSVLNAIRTAMFTGTMPQNVNYAVKSRYVVELLEDAGVSYQVDPMPGPKSRIVENVEKATVLVKVKKKSP